MSKVTVKQAAQLTGKSRETINSATKSGRLSFTLNASSNKVIDVVELERVYPLVKTLEEIKQPPKPVSPRQAGSDPDAAAELARLTERLAASEAMRLALEEERGRERRQLEDEVQNLRDTLSKSQEQHNKALLLITDQSKDDVDRAGDWERSIRALEKRLSNQEQRAQKDRERILEARRRAEKYRRALQSERRKPWWRKLVGE